MNRKTTIGKLIYSTRQVFVPVLCCMAVSLFGQGETCETAVVAGIGIHFSDGPFSGFGASGISCGDAVVNTVMHSDWFIFMPQSDGFYTITSTIDPGATDTRLKVWDGTSGCASLTCIAGNDDGGTGFTSLVTTCLSAGTVYYIEWDDKWSTNGFLWQITLDSEVSCAPPENEACIQAYPVSTGTPVAGFTTFASVDAISLCDDVTISTAGGIWYEVEGNGNIYSATTCMPGTNFDTQLSVFSGSCGSLVCVAGNDDQPGPLDPECDGANISLNTSSSVSWQTVDGDHYFIHVTGYESNSGHVELLVTDPAGPCGQAESSTVTETADGITGSLRKVVDEACNGDTILFDPSLAGDTLYLPLGEISINKDLVILGPGAGITLNGGGSNRILRVYPDRVLDIRNIALTHGSNIILGGAFLNEGTIRLSNVLFEENFEGMSEKAFSNEGVVQIFQGNIIILR